METLELTPLKGKSLRLLLVQKAYDEPWWVTSSPLKESESGIRFIQRASMAYCEMIKSLAEKEEPDFVTDEMGMRSTKEFLEMNPLVETLAKLGVPYRAVDMDEFARSYLAHSLEQKIDRRNEIFEAIESLSERDEDSETVHQIDQLATYGQYLQNQLEDEIRDIEFGIRESWIAMGILKEADSLNKKKVKALHLCSPQHFQGLRELMETLNVEVIPISFKSVASEAPGGKVKGITELTGISSVKMVPVVKRPKTKMQNILFFLEADEYASPFDICVAYDAGFDVVVPYPRVSADNVTTLVQDAIFSRGVKGVKRTSFFLGGRDVPTARKMAKDVKEAMVKPFTTAVVVDPHGAFTTSAALVAKAEASLPAMGVKSLSKVKVLVLAGTGPVGESVAALCGAAGAKTTLTSRSADRAREVAKRLSTDEFKIRGIRASTPEETQAALEKATLVFVTGAPGIQLVTKDLLENVPANQILLDANAVPPPGIANLKPSDDLRELAPGKFGIGPLAVGDLKLKVQRDILTEAREKGKGIYDDASALEMARAILKELVLTGKIHPPEQLVKAK
ncbi:MAG: NAD(P)-dependent methylenetetrahydromethanopterin dehydrogenase [Candidatus Thorarchaeota archaeon]